MSTSNTKNTIKQYFPLKDRESPYPSTETWFLHQHRSELLAETVRQLRKVGEEIQLSDLILGIKKAKSICFRKQEKVNRSLKKRKLKLEKGKSRKQKVKAKGKVKEIIKKKITKARQVTEPLLPVERWSYDPPNEIHEIEEPIRPHPYPANLKRLSPKRILESLKKCYGKPKTSIETCGWWCFHVVIPPSTTKHVSDRFLTHFFSPIRRGSFELWKMCVRHLEAVDKEVYDHCLELLNYFYKLGHLEDDKWGNEKVYRGYSRVLTFAWLEDYPEAKGRPMHIDPGAVYQYGTPILSYDGCEIIEDFHDKNKTVLRPYEVGMYDGVNHHHVIMKPGSMHVVGRCLSVCSRKGKPPPAKEQLIFYT